MRWTPYVETAEMRVILDHVWTVAETPYHFAGADLAYRRLCTAHARPRFHAAVHAVVHAVGYGPARGPGRTGCAKRPDALREIVLTWRCQDRKN